MKKGIEPKYKFLGILLLFVIGIIVITAAPVGTKPIPGHNGSQIQPGTILGDRMADNLNLTGNVSISDVLNVNGNVNANNLYNKSDVDAIMSMPIGSITMWTTSTPPLGWLIADGSSVSRTTYATLFAIINTTYGAGDGSTTFNLPDTRGIFIKGAGTTNRATGKDANGNYYTGILGTYLTDKIQGHFHNAGGVLNSRASGTTTTAWGIYISDTNDGLAGARFPITDGTNGAPRTGMTTEPQSLGLYYIIKFGNYNQNQTYEVNVQNFYSKSANIDTGNYNIVTNGSVGIGTTSFNDSGGVLQIKDGITFPASQSALANVNTLDDYEEGTWNGTLTPTGSGTITMGLTEGKYIKIGKKVTCIGLFSVSSVSSPVGQLFLTGLPFTSGSGTSNYAAVNIYGDTLNSGATGLSGYVETNTNYILIYTRFAAGTPTSNAADIKANSNIVIQATYFVA